MVMNMDIKLQFGAGGNYKKGWINIDIDKSQGADVAWDMNVFPYPFKDCSADIIICEHTLEHLKYPSKVLREFHRIIKPHGSVVIEVPHFSHPYALVADLHICQFNSAYFRNFVPHNNIENGWKCKDVDFKWNNLKQRIILPKGIFIFNYIIEEIINISPTTQYIYECFFVRLIIATAIRATYQNKEK